MKRGLVTKTFTAVAPHRCAVTEYTTIHDGDPAWILEAFIRKSECGLVLGIVYLDIADAAWRWRSSAAEAEGIAPTKARACAALDQVLEADGWNVRDRDVAQTEAS